MIEPSDEYREGQDESTATEGRSGTSWGALLLGLLLTATNLGRLTLWVHQILRSGDWPGVRVALDRYGADLRGWLRLLASEVAIGLLFYLLSRGPSQTPWLWRALGRGFLLGVLLTAGILFVAWIGLQPGGAGR
jgi:hypothetical protein